jgi:diketogulonate reductase-like aldo/keto reductase
MSSAKIPAFLYGTAWKGDKTRHLVQQALLNGFRAIDTAAQPKHYREDLVGEGIRDALKAGRFTREDIYLQTKFTGIHGQDLTRIPYDASTSITIQVSTSVKSSLRNLRHGGDEDAYLDCLVLHSPLPSMAQTQKAWRAMESHVPRSVRTLGLSNFYDLSLLRKLYTFARVKPVVLQNRFYPGSGYDGAIRGFCHDHDIIYQSFWTLTANPHLLECAPVSMVAESAQVSRPVALYSLVLGLGNVRILNGTTNAQTMRDDLTGLERVEKWRGEHDRQWDEMMEEFNSLLK